MKLANTVFFTTGITGTSDFSDGTAEAGYRNLTSAGLTNGETYSYRAVNPGNASEWENGLGTYSSTGPTLARTTVYESSNANAKVDFSASPLVILTPLAQTIADSIADGSSKVMMTTAERTKLSGIETGATADQSDGEIETAYNNQVSVISQAEAEAGTATTVRRWTAQRVAQAIAALAGGGGTFISSQTIAATSGSYKDFTIPAGTRRILMFWNAVHLNSGGGTLRLQWGDAGGIEGTVYELRTVSESTYGWVIPLRSPDGLTWYHQFSPPYNDPSKMTTTETSTTLRVAIQYGTYGSGSITCEYYSE